MTFKGTAHRGKGRQQCFSFSLPPLSPPTLLFRNGGRNPRSFRLFGTSNNHDVSYQNLRPPPWNLYSCRREIRNDEGKYVLDVLRRVVTLRHAAKPHLHGNAAGVVVGWRGCCPDSCDHTDSGDHQRWCSRPACGAELLDCSRAMGRMHVGLCGIAKCPVHDPEWPNRG